MKAAIDVENKKEAELIRKGLEEPATRALVKVMGALAALPSDRARKRVVNHVIDWFDEHNWGEDKIALSQPINLGGGDK